MDEEIRINKYLSKAGVCSRREADRLLEEGRITSLGRVLIPGDKISPKDRVEIDGKPVVPDDERILIAYNKPRGIVVTSAGYEGNIIKAINYPKRIFPVGRLDKESTGLILLTNEGELSNEICRAANHHEKEYVVTADKPVTKGFVRQMSEGVRILDTVTRPCKVWQTGDKEFHIILTQGLNRQIRRMCEYLKYRVVSLHRIRIMNINLGDLPEGRYRDVSPDEKKELISLLKKPL